MPVKGFGPILLALAPPVAFGVIAGACRRPSAPAHAEIREPEAKRIVPGNAAAAEFLAVLLGDGGASRVAAMPEQVDAYSSLDFLRPPWKSIARFSRYGAETLIAMHPDLVVTHEWQAAETTQILRAQGIPVLVLPSARSYAEVRGTLDELGRTLGLEDRARAAVLELDRRVARLREGAAGRKDLRVLEYANNGTGGWTAGADTTIDAMIRMAGLRNAAAEAGLKGHVVLDLERLVAIDPDVIVAGTPARDEAGSPTKDILEKTPALANLSAVKKGRVLVLSAKLLSADSPCLVDAAERLAAEVDARIAGAPGPPGK